MGRHNNREKVDTSAQDKSLDKLRKELIKPKKDYNQKNYNPKNKNKQICKRTKNML